ncbi:pilus assembly protein TadG-related protein [Streptomyces sp. NPDC051211]|uniref:pilus assembly protein TadG-related protein n=1 Tax=Streptomyces sp. NPDC051211 TaxID=3154643 RepID=UPI00344D81FB
MVASGARDQGQAFPLYVGTVAVLLFAALAFVVVGMAGATRSQAQGAADAAALAAAREARDSVFTGLVLQDLKPEEWQEILDGEFFDAEGACDEAESFAALNDSGEAPVICEPSLPRFTVTVQTNDTVGKSVIPGSDTFHATATATAVIEPRCSLSSDPTPEPTPPPGDETDKPDPDPVNFECDDDRAFKLDPLNPGKLADLARSLFKVRLDG